MFNRLLTSERRPFVKECFYFVSLAGVAVLAILVTTIAFFLLAWGLDTLTALFADYL
jgi:hypothetical protein